VYYDSAIMQYKEAYYIRSGRGEWYTELL